MSADKALIRDTSRAILKIQEVKEVSVTHNGAHRRIQVVFRNNKELTIPLSSSPRTATGAIGGSVRSVRRYLRANPVI